MDCFFQLIIQYNIDFSINNYVKFNFLKTNNLIRYKFYGNRAHTYNYYLVISFNYALKHIFVK